MKKLFVILLFTGIFLASGNGFAQAQIKLGHINSSLLFAAMPESDSAQKQLERSSAEMQQTLEGLNVEFNRKYEEYMKLTNDATSSRTIISTKEEELQSIQQRIQTFQQNAEQEITNLRSELFKPIQDKAIAAVTDVASANGFTYIFDTAGGSLVYTAPDSQDILPLVKTKLGLK